MTDTPPTLLQKLKRTSLVTQIVIGLIAGILLAWLAPSAALSVAFIGKVFVSALKAVAPILVFVLVMASIANHKHGQETHIRPILVLYLFGTFAAAVVAVIASMMFPSNLVLATENIAITAPGGISEVLQSLLLSVVDNPVNALVNANFIGILAWAIGMGVAIRHAGDTTRTVLNDLSNGVTLIVRVVIRFAPLGIFGLVAATLASSGFGVGLDQAVGELQRVGGGIADALDAVDCGYHADQLGEVGQAAAFGQATVAVDVLAKQGHFTHAVFGQVNDLGQHVIERSADLLATGVGHHAERAVLAATFHH